MTSRGVSGSIGMKTFVVTSINPASKLNHQRRCFQGWQSLGMDVFSFNARYEADLLVQAGFPESSIRCISDEHSGKAIFGKSVPLIRPLLETLRNQQQWDCVILTNSDIYPAVRNPSIVNYWAAHGPALALAREEIHSLSAHGYDSTSPYRGGLDIFVFQRDALENVIGVLNHCTSSARMAFGMPGWDYLMTASLLSNNVGGKVFDSHVLIHQSHKPTYGNMNEFANYVPDLRRLGKVNYDDPVEAADEFARLIERECRQNQQASRMAKLLYYESPQPASIFQTENAEFNRCRRRMNQLAPGMEDYYRRRSISSLFERLASDPNTPLETALSLICNSNSKWFLFNQALYAIVFALKAKPELARKRCKQVYPKGNQHKAALRNILNRHDEDDPLRRFWIARLFGSELVDHGIFNSRLYKYLVLATENDCELQLVEEIFSMIQLEEQNAA